MAGGAKTVTFPADQLAALTKWPRYGDAEKQAITALLDNNKFYDELPLFEKEWQEYTQSPFVKSHMNGSSALTSMYFALDLPPGSEQGFAFRPVAARRTDAAAPTRSRRC